MFQWAFNKLTQVGYKGLFIWGIVKGRVYPTYLLTLTEPKQYVTTAIGTVG